MEELSCDKVNTTDSDSETLQASGGFVQGYNVQIVVTRNQVILAAKNLTQERNDFHQLHPMIEETLQNLVALGYGMEPLETLLADEGGDCSRKNLHPQKG